MQVTPLRCGICNCDGTRTPDGDEDLWYCPMCGFWLGCTEAVA